METHSHVVVLLTDETAEESASARRRRERGIHVCLTTIGNVGI